MKITLRKWQDEALKKALGSIEALKRDFLCEAGVGSGKTIYAAEVARKSLEARNVNRIIVVTATRHLVKQWKKAMASRGVILQNVTSNEVLHHGIPSDAQGYVMTFQAMSCDPDLHADFISNSHSMVIIDEVHHLAEIEEESSQSDWGSCAKYAFEKAIFRLSLSGTPFRSSGQKIPFLTYSDKNLGGLQFAIPDFSYGYGKSVAEEVCRQIVFKPYYGRVQFRLDKDSYDLDMKDSVPVFLQQERLKNANRADVLNDLICAAFKDAHSQLTDLRDNGDPNAGGLIIANTIDHARVVSSLFTSVTGEVPVIVLSDEEDAAKTLGEFEGNSKPWMISVRMVSEGVDIPRLRVLVYCSNVTEDLYIIQALGRVVRQKEGCPGPSYIFFPGDPRLLQIANTIEDEIQRAIREHKKAEGGKPGTPKEREFFSADGNQGTNIVGGTELDRFLVAQAEELRRTFTILGNCPTKTVVEMMNQIRGKPSTFKEDEEFSEAEKHDEIRKRRRKDVNNKARAYTLSHDLEFSEVFSALFDSVHCADMDTASNDQLLKMLNTLKEWEKSSGPVGSR